MRISAKLILPLAAFLATATAVLAREGGIGDGGGNGFSSTPQEIRDYATSRKPLSQLSYDWSAVYLRLEAVQLFNPTYAPNETVKRVQQAILRSYPGKQIYQVLRKTKLVPKEVCRGPQGEVVDSSTKHKLDSPICINAKSLARYPSDSLKQELISLLFHEWRAGKGRGPVLREDCSPRSRCSLALPGRRNGVEAPAYALGSVSALGPVWRL